MRPSRLKQLIIGTFVAVILTSGILTTRAEAQDRSAHKPRPAPRRIIVYRPYHPFYHPFYDPFRYPYYNYRVVDPIAYQRELGYSEGQDEGEEDAKKGRPANPTGHKDYLKSDSLTFREAFVKGYNEGYQEELAEIREKMRERRGD
jgi:hypothetical protein